MEVLISDAALVAFLELLALLRRADVDLRDTVLFGSAVLYLHGIRKEIGDVDVFVRRAEWSRLFALEDDVRGHSLAVEVPRAGDPPFLSWQGAGVPIHVFYDWTKRDPWMTAEQCFAERVIVGGWFVIPLSLLRYHKLGATSSKRKHDTDLALIEEALRD